MINVIFMKEKVRERKENDDNPVYALACMAF